MIEWLSAKIARALVDSGTVKEEDKDIYVYGMDVILSTVANILCVLAIGIILGRFLGTIIFLAFFIPLRSTAGGYHAGTHLKCFLIMLLVYGATAAMDFLLPQTATRWLSPAFAMVSLCMVIMLAPAPHENRPVSASEFLKFRKLSLWLASGETAAVLLGVVSGIGAPAFWASAGMLASAVSLCAACMGGKKRRNSAAEGGAAG